MPEKFIEDLLEDMRTEQTRVNGAINELVELQRNGGKYTLEAFEEIVESIKSKAGTKATAFLGSPRPTPVIPE